MIKLDIKDKKLLHELEKNARASMSFIAKKIGTSKEVANYRFKKLVSIGFIKRVYPLIDNFIINQRIYRLVLDLYNLKKFTREKMIKDLKDKKNISLNVFLQSNRDLEISLYVKDPWEFHEFYNVFFGKYAQYIKRKELSIVTKRYYFGHRYLYDSQNVVILGKTKKIITIDETDEKIIDLLVINPRIHVIKIASNLEITPSAVIYRLKKLIKKEIIKGYSIAFDKDLLGYTTYRVEIILNDLSQKDKLIDYLSNKINVTKINEFIGEMDLDFEVDFSTAKELDNFLNKLRIDVPKIKNFEVINVVQD